MLKKIFKFSFEIVFLLIMLSSLIWNDMVIYGISQGKGQLTIVWNSQPIEEIVQDATFPDSLKQKLKLIIEIKKYAFDSIGINESDNYSTVYNQRNKPILLTVSACEPFSFKAKEWTFPFLGAVSYKGFFNKNEATKEILALKGKGYDVDVYSPSGWSTLGWFKDPILSNMLYKSEGQLANLIIHELTHGTIYVKNNVTFNENLANFIGDKGAEKFLIYKYGINSKQYTDYEQSKKDETCFKEYILKGTERLDSLYSTLFVTDTVEIKKQKKIKLIKEIVLGVNRLPLYKRKNYFNYSLQAFSEKNAFFMAFTRYDSQYEIFDKEYQKDHQSNLRNYLSFLKEKHL
ncbi:MAG: aminopeptidase [Bacteroidetes bacterium]|nr:aminopeptidase [Bacteroidota bacterium]